MSANHPAPGITPDHTLQQLQATIAGLRASCPTQVIREQFGRSMVQYAADYPQLIAITADLMYATGMAPFGAQFPDRLVNVGIAEQNMAGVAAGLASCGKLPVACGYAAFTSLRAVEQAKVDCAYNEVKVILAGLSAGLSYGVGGPTHQTYEDVAIMRAIPNMTVVVPSDAVEVDQALRACLDHPRAAPIYLRLGRGPEHTFNVPDAPFAIGQARRLRDGDEVSIIANGSMVFEALLASDALAQIGIRASVVNMHTVKPIDAAAILREAAHCKAMVVAEEHSVIGGLGSAVLEVLRAGHAFPVDCIGIEDFYPPIGPTPELRASLGLHADHIAARVLQLLQQVGHGVDRRAGDSADNPSNRQRQEHTA
ncbi:MAG: transketolase C-terminal domain-containing protein [Polaromonas sp.]|nr:transketolase C-terminal domain-containing protein [Polaromonas sp.]